jgi:methionyl-tRNA formyltransferase
MKTKMFPRIIFFGTPEFSVPCLQALKTNHKNIVLTVTQPDQPSGRGKKMSSPPIKKFCDENGLACIQPKSIKTDQFLKQIREFKPDLFIIVAYGKIFPKTLLDLVPLSINVHASILPRWRGASPISQSIYHQDAETGVSIMKLVEQLDAGPVMHIKKIPIDDHDDTASLTHKLSKVGSIALIEALNLIEQDQYKFTEQDNSKVTFAPVLKVENAKIQWTMSAVTIQHHIRAFSPWPGAYTSDGIERIKIFKSNLTSEKSNEKPGTLRRQKKRLSVACSDLWLDILEAQRPNKNKQGIVDFLNGYSHERILWT